MLNIIKIWPLLLLTLVLIGCGPGEPPPLTASGKELYLEYCAGCHQSSGSGKFFMGIPPAIGHGLSRQQVIRLIREGAPEYDDMPVFPQIRFSQADKIARYLRELEQAY